MVSAADAGILWRAGKLKYKLHPGQKQLHDIYRAWRTNALAARQKGEKLAGRYPRVFVADCSRRFGKDYWGVLSRIEDAIQKPDTTYTYATAFQKDITDIVIPIFEKIIEDAPLSIKPVFRGSSQSNPAGYFFPNKSAIKLIGIERNPDGLRGRPSDGITISEAGFVDRLQYTVESVLMPMMQGQLHADLVMNSTPPQIPGHPYDDVFCPDAFDNGRYFMRTIEDNPRLTESEREEFITAAGGRESDTCRREYYCVRIRSTDRVVVPEFDEKVHVQELSVPEYAQAYTIVDPGVRDMCAVSLMYYDFQRCQVVLVNEWAKSGANTDEVVQAIKRLEAESFSNLKFWDGSKFRDNPYQRYSDTEARLILDLNSTHGLKIGAVNKDGAEAALHAMRNAFQSGQLVVHPRCKRTIAHLRDAVWNKARTSYERSQIYGHFDLVDCTKYGWRMINKTHNPNPPRGITLNQAINSDNLWLRDHHKKTRNTVKDNMSAVLPKGYRTRGRK
jgi:hypothetical protein